jgi:3-oxoacyl-[acyl-carrier protein] reductase/pteridine reductase
VRIGETDSTARYNKCLMQELQGKVAVVTGGAKRIGREIAFALARAGADVAITFNTSAKEARRTMIDFTSFGGRGLALHCDVRDEPSVLSMVMEVRRELGGIDILVNNAAIYETVDFEKITLDQWDNIFATNTRGPFLVSQAAAKELRRRKGRIINIGSLGGMKPWSTHAHYCSSKAALHMLTKVMAKALAPEITVNCVAPGVIDFGEKKRNAQHQRFAKATPMGVNGTGSDIAAAALFFATCPRFITGQILAVDGGLSLK